MAAQAGSRRRCQPMRCDTSTPSRVVRQGAGHRGTRRSGLRSPARGRNDFGVPFELTFDGVEAATEPLLRFAATGAPLGVVAKSPTRVVSDYTVMNSSSLIPLRTQWISDADLIEVPRRTRLNLDFDMKRALVAPGNVELRCSTASCRPAIGHRARRLVGDPHRHVCDTPAGLDHLLHVVPHQARCEPQRTPATTGSAPAR